MFPQAAECCRMVRPALLALCRRLHSSPLLRPLLCWCRSVCPQKPCLPWMDGNQLDSIGPANLPCLDSEPCLSFSEAEHNGHNISVRHIGFQLTGGASGDNSCQRMLRPLVQFSAQLMPKGSFDPTWISSILVSSPMCWCSALGP